MQVNTKYVTVILLLPAILLLLAACAAPQAQQSEKPIYDSLDPRVKLTRAILGDIKYRTTHVALTEARERVTLTPLGTGLIEELYVGVGDTVKKGQIVAQLDDGTLNEQLRQSQARLNGAEALMASTKAAVGPDQLAVQAQLNAAQARLDRLREPSALDIQAAVSSVDKAESELDSAIIQLKQLKNPDEARLASARASVVSAESVLSKAQVVANEAIRNQSEASGHLLWESLLEVRLDLQKNQAFLRNLRQAFGLRSDDSAFNDAQKAVEQSDALIPSMVSRLHADVGIPRDVNDALWGESSAQAKLEEARAGLKELENPPASSIEIAENSVAGARASWNTAVAELDLLQDPSPAGLAKAEAELAEAERAATRASNEHVQYEIESAQSKIDQASAEIAVTQQQISELEVVAPFDGLVSKRWLSPGAVASPSTPVFTLISDDLLVSLQIEEGRVNSIERGSLATFTSPALLGTTVEMQIDRISPDGNRQDNTFYVELSPVSTTSGLRPGMSGEVYIESVHRDVVLVPKEAMVREGNQRSLVVVQDGRPQFLRVETGLEDSEHVEIRSGIQPRQQIVLSGHIYLDTDGTFESQ